MGGAGDDTLTGGAGADALNGGEGVDLAGYETALAAVRVDMAAPGLNLGDAAGDSLDGIEGLAGSAFADTLLGDGQGNRILGGRRARLAGRADWRRHLHGGDGHDRLHGGEGADLLEGGTGNDRLEGGTGDDTVLGGDGKSLLLRRRRRGFDGWERGLIRDNDGARK